MNSFTFYPFFTELYWLLSNFIQIHKKNCINWSNPLALLVPICLHHVQNQGCPTSSGGPLKGNCSLGDRIIKCSYETLLVTFNRYDIKKERVFIIIKSKK